MTLASRIFLTAFSTLYLTLFFSNPALSAMESEQPLEQAYVNVDPDISVLSERLEGSSALGFFAKLDLKHRFEKLLEDVDRYHKGEGTDIEGLKRRFNDILVRTLQMIEKNDPALHKDLLSAREAIWLALHSGELLKDQP